MIILPNDYQKEYICINESGSTSKIYANKRLTNAYKIYNKQFDYNEEKMEEFLKINNPNCLSSK